MHIHQVPTRDSKPTVVEARTPDFFVQLAERLSPLVVRLFTGEKSPELESALKPLVYELEIVAQRSLAALRALPKEALVGKDRLGPLSTLAHLQKLIGTSLAILEGVPSDELAYAGVTKKRVLDGWGNLELRKRMTADAILDIQELPKLDHWLEDFGV